MAELEMDLDPIALMHKRLDSQLLNPVTAAGIAGIAGVDSVGMTTEGEQFRPARLVMASVGVPFNWRLPVTEEGLEAVMSNPPAKVTFIDPRRDDNCLDLQRGNGMEEALQKIRPVKSMELATRIPNDIRQLKTAYKMGVNAVELDCRDYTCAESKAQRLEALEAISGVARVAQKYEIRVTATGGLDAGSIKNLMELEIVDTFSIGRALLGKAIYVGLENALRDYFFLIK